MSILIQNILTKKNKEPFCEDIVNSLAKTDRDFHWSRAYSQYLDLPVEDVLIKNLRASGLVKFGCMPGVFDVLELVMWHGKRFDVAIRVI